MSVAELRGRLRRSDRPVSVAVIVGDLLLCCAVFLMMLGYGATTRAEETASWVLGGQIYGGWLAAGLTLFAVAGLRRALLSHLATMLLTPGALLFLVLLVLLVL
ncbi:hypothetical protein ACFE3N_26025 [Streptomyces albidoflavus]|uniref:hypothetical protein n=2 Tax=Streptomyces TaxID=1883 RepID=UPI00332F2753